jgi:hypothetical protein
MGTYYDHQNRRAFETEVRRNPETGAIERIITREIPYLGEPPFSPPEKGKGATLSREQADRLRQDIYGFFLHADDSPLDATVREQLARYVAWREKHGGNL